MMRHALLGIMLGLAMLALAGCAASTATPAQELPTLESATPAPTRTPRPTQTPAPTSTPTAVPTDSGALNAAGPWLIFLANTDGLRGDRSMWAMNPDGSGLTQIFAGDIVAFDVQPVQLLDGGVRIAIVTGSDTNARELVLSMLHLPGGELEIITSLINDKEGQPPINEYDAREAARSGGLVWSEEGDRLAFVGQIDGPSMDVYLYHVFDGSITRLSSGDEQAFQLSWSPDRQFVIHGSFTFTGMGGPETQALWAAQANGQGSIRLAQMKHFGGDFTGSIWRWGWPDDSHLLVMDHQFDDEPSTLYSVNITDGTKQTLISAVAWDMAYSPRHDVWLLVPPCCSGVPIRMYRNGQFEDIGEYQDWNYVWWDDEYDVFLAMADSGRLMSVSPDGVITDLNIQAKGYPMYPFIDTSPDGSLWAWVDFEFYMQASNLSIGPPMTDPTLISTSEDPNNPAMSPEDKFVIQDVIWSPDSQRLLLLTSRGLWMAERPDFAPVFLSNRVFMNSYWGWGGEWTPVQP